MISQTLTHVITVSILAVLILISSAAQAKYGDGDYGDGCPGAPLDKSHTSPHFVN